MPYCSATISYSKDRRTITRFKYIHKYVEGKECDLWRQGVKMSINLCLLPQCSWCAHWTSYCSTTVAKLNIHTFKPCNSSNYIKCQSLSSGPEMSSTVCTLNVSTLNLIEMFWMYWAGNGFTGFNRNLLFANWKIRNVLISWHYSWLYMHCLNNDAKSFCNMFLQALKCQASFECILYTWPSQRRFDNITDRFFIISAFIDVF